MTKLKSMVAVLVGCSMSIAGAATTSVAGNNLGGPAPGSINVITDQFGTPLANGTGLASLGYFGTLSDAQVDTFVSTNNFAALIAAFVGLADTGFGTSTLAPGFAGFYEVNSTGGAALDYTNDGGKSMYSFYSNTGTLGTATEIGLYRHNDTISLVDPSPSPTDGYSLANQGEGFDGNVLLGSSSTVNLDLGAGPTDYESMALIGIPEPSAALLSLLGLACLVRRRR